MKIEKFIRNPSNLISFAVGLIPTLIVYLAPADKKISFGIFVVVVFLLLVVIWICLLQWLQAKDMTEVSHIPISKCIDDIIICRTNPLLAQGTILEFYEIRENYEKNIACGYVEIVNNSRMSQIKVLCSLVDGKNKNSITKYIEDNYERIYIRPSVSNSTLDTVIMLREGKYE